MPTLGISVGLDAAWAAIAGQVSSTYVYLEAGQSNSNGFTGGSATFNYSFTNTETYFKPSQTNAADDGTFQVFEYGVNSNAEGGSYPDPSIYFAQQYEQNNTNPLKIIQVGQGGTGFENGAGLWASGGSLRNALENHYIKPALSKLSKEPTKIRLLPFFWIQGERDATSNAFASAYQAELTSFISDIRSWVGIPDFPVVILRLNSNLPNDSFPEVSTIQSAQESIAFSDPNVYLINSDSFELGPDSLHYTATGYEQIALAYNTLANSIGSRVYLDSGSVEIATPIAIAATTSDTISVSATTGEYATLFAGVYASGSPIPSVEELKTGAGTGFVSNSSQNIIYDTEGIAVISGLTAESSYSVFAILEDLSDNTSTIAALSATTDADSSGTLLFSDTFTNDNNTNLSAHTPEAGAGWNNSNFKILNNRAVQGDGSPSAMGYIATVNYGAAHNPAILQVSCDITIDGIAGILLRYINIGEALLLQFRENDSQIRLFRRATSASWALETTRSVPIPSGTSSVVIQDSGTQIRVKYGTANAEVFSISTFGNSVTPGIWIQNTGSGTTYDNFVVGDIPSFTL